MTSKATLPQATVFHLMLAGLTVQPLALPTESFPQVPAQLFT